MVKVVIKRCIQKRLCMQLYCTVSLGLGLVDWRKIALSNTERERPSKTRLTELPDRYLLKRGLEGQKRQCSTNQRRVK